MKILANYQDKAVGGIVRMMNTFVESVVKTNTSVSFFFAIVSSSSEMNILERRRTTKKLYGFDADHLVLSSDYYPEILKSSNSLGELKNKLSDLVDFYLECIEKSKPDVILINGTYYRPWALLQAARKKNIPYVVYVHGSVVHEAQGLPDSTLSILVEMEKDFYAKDVNYIFPSIAALKGMTFSNSEEQNNFHIIYNSLDKVFFTPKKIHNNSPHMVGFVLRWEKVKNTDFILDFIKFNKDSLKPYHIKIVSDLGDEKIDLYKDDFVDFLPPKTKDEMVKFYQELDIILNPSFFETFGYVPAEAVAGGTPAMISSSQGLSEVFLKCGLERLISDFEDVSVIHKKIPSIIEKGISEEEIEKLRVELDPDYLSKKILTILSRSIESR